METKAFVDALSQALGQEMEDDGNGAFALTLDGVHMLLLFRESDHSFLAHMDIGYPTGLGNAIHARLLGANFLLSETEGAAISLDEQTGMACLEAIIPVTGLDGQQFVNRVEAFVHQADIWTRRLHQWNQEIEAQVSAGLDALDRELERADEEGAEETTNGAVNPMLQV